MLSASGRDEPRHGADCVTTNCADVGLGLRVTPGALRGDPVRLFEFPAEQNQSHQCSLRDREVVLRYLQTPLLNPGDADPIKCHEGDSGSTVRKLTIVPNSHRRGAYHQYVGP